MQEVNSSQFLSGARRRDRHGLPFGTVEDNFDNAPAETPGHRHWEKTQLWGLLKTAGGPLML